MKPILLPLTLVFLFSCGSSVEPQKNETEKNDDVPMEKTKKKVSAAFISLQDVYFMEGTWIDATGEMQGFHEKWVKQGDSLMQIVGYFVDGKDTSITEAIKVKMDHGLLHYIPKVEDQNNGEEVPFELQDGSTLDSLVFANYNHDFPREIIYVKRDNQNVDVYLIGIGKKEEPQQYTLHLKKK